MLVPFGFSSAIDALLLSTFRHVIILSSSDIDISSIFLFKVNLYPLFSFRFSFAYTLIILLIVSYENTQSKTSPISSKNLYAESSKASNVAY